MHLLAAPLFPNMECKVKLSKKLCDADDENGFYSVEPCTSRGGRLTSKKEHLHCGQRPAMKSVLIIKREKHVMLLYNILL